MPSKATKAAKASNAGSTSKSSGKTPAQGSRAWANQVGGNRRDASRKAGRDTSVNWD